MLHGGENEMETLKSLWQRMCMVSGEAAEQEWREAQQEFTPAEMAAEIMAADYEGTFSGQWGERGLSSETYEYLQNIS